jgi:hypothetical protein
MGCQGKWLKGRKFSLQVLKFALYGCDKAVEAKDAPTMALDSAERMAIAAFAVISFIYIGQRSASFA